MFIDSAKIYVKAGNGGDGIVAFHREKYRPRGGPSGGDGGKGGDVILFTDPQKHTLLDFRYKRKFVAKNGFPGEGSRKSGKNGESLIIPVPPGTVVFDSDSCEVLHDLQT
ncbi:MAG: GTPase ObgE, partial [Candidatus Marinimicrobia bacterium]|nr:GTPase ObgE [Candidatus Neomarinimicrobiota bacterium]